MSHQSLSPIINYMTSVLCWKMDWSKQTVLEFLSLYESESIIWDPSSPEHKNRNEIYEAWKRISIKMGEKYTIAELKKKKESLMASYRTCLKKIRQSFNKSGLGSESVYKPQWFAFDKMFSFLGDKEDTVITEVILFDEDGCIEDVKETGRLEWEEIQNEALGVAPSPKPSMKPPLRKKLKTEVKEEHAVKTNINADHAYSLLEAVASSIHKQPTKERDVSEIFGQLVAAKLASMDERTRDICMHRIDNILFEMKMNPATNYLPNNQDLKES